MKKLYLLCLVTLIAVVLDIALFHTRSAAAQPGASVHIERGVFSGKTTNTDVPATGHVVGFQCIDTSSGPQCFVASSFAAGNSN
jgi:hypothetical protein